MHIGRKIHAKIMQDAQNGKMAICADRCEAAMSKMLEKGDFPGQKRGVFGLIRRYYIKLNEVWHFDINAVWAYGFR